MDFFFFFISFELIRPCIVAKNSIMSYVKDHDKIWTMRVLIRQTCFTINKDISIIYLLNIDVASFRYNSMKWITIWLIQFDVTFLGSLIFCYGRVIQTVIVSDANHRLSFEICSDFLHALFDWISHRDTVKIHRTLTTKNLVLLVFQEKFPG